MPRARAPVTFPTARPSPTPPTPTRTPGACTSCHPVSASRPSDPAGSPHHTIPAPILAAASPRRRAGPRGTAVTLTGSRFTYAAVVRFGGVSASFVVDSDTQLRAVVPAQARDRTGERALRRRWIPRQRRGVRRQRQLRLPAPALSLAVPSGARVRRPPACGSAARLTPAGLSPAAAVSFTPVQRRAERRVEGRRQNRVAHAGRVRRLRLVVHGAARAGAYRASVAAAGVTSGWAAFRVR